ncbi:DNA helicase-4 [Peribacillus frigoritolerans]|uniref:UvrD-helicase domain-containing protein n=1 Tax=Peribacillus frigoritolerans TaxID=450367 RepID=UPI0020A173C9|nr:UvrD-helicase domain-containing protein [Peribacillus frigoritolerans]MCP1495136.1 DNA helicase-4 [Peribacillus frigoritolerans]
MNLINVFLNYFKKKRYLKHITKINQHLDLISNVRQKELEGIVRELAQTRNIMQQDELFDDIKKLYQDDYNYLSLNNPFSLNDQILSYFTKEKALIKVSTEFEQINKRFLNVKNDYLTIFNGIPQIIKNTNEQIEFNYNNLNKFTTELNMLKQEYISKSLTDLLLNKYEDTYLFYMNGKFQEIQDQSVKQFLECYKDLNKIVPRLNEVFISKRIKEQESLFSNIDGKSLDMQQRKAIVTDEDNNLIIAGAGSGKTLTISGKVKYLIDVLKVKPEEILLISFTNKASGEMYERISKKLNVNVEVKTFHKLGLEIIARYNRAKPNIYEKQTELISNYMYNEIYTNEEQIKKLIEFFGYYLNVPKNIEEFDNLGEYYEHYKNVDFETLKSKMDRAQYIKSNTQQLSQNLKTIGGEAVKSLEEFLIANFLFLNGIKYEYEKEYEYNTRDQNYRQYKPDFYLPEYDIYIEHFGVNERMRAPWLNAFEERKYIEGIHWKRQLHKEKSTKLIESFSFYNKLGILLEKLEENLIKNNVKLKEVDFIEIFSAVYDQGKNRYFKEFIKLVQSFINLFKSNGYSVEKFEDFFKDNENINRNNIFFYKRTQLFFEIVEPIFIYYQEDLKKKEEIDFHDMINKATDIVEKGHVHFNYKYIIVDEFQDISKSRFNLINTIKAQTQAKVMCVGDDWQSIFRFAGSDLEMFTHFEKYFGFSKIQRIEKTYRNSQKLIDIAGDFVMKNPSQFKKNLKSDKQNDFPIKLIGYQKDKVDALTIAIDDIVNQYGGRTEILLLGRNNFDLSFLEDSIKFNLVKNKKTGQTQIFYNKNKSLKILFLTVHKSKGLEADNVIIINAESNLVGFPNKISDDPLLSWVLTDSDNYDFAEERRLFYVALTRTKNITYILTPEYKTSVFIKELQKNYNIQYITNGHEKSISENPNCPRCKSGKMVLHTSRKKNFLGCTNFPKCEYTINRVDVLTKQLKCDKCGSFMVRKKGRYGIFYGCTNFPKCKNSKNLNEV